MRLMESFITLDDLRFHAYHGVLPQERQVGNEYRMSLKIGYDIARAMETDDVADTLNYATVYQEVAEEMRKPSALLEHVAGRIGSRLMEAHPEIKEIRLRLVKCNPPMGADSQGAGVELHLINDKT